MSPRSPHSNLLALYGASLLLAPSAVALAQETVPDPYFMPTTAKSTPYMPRVITRNIREDRAGNLWFATFGGPIRYDGKTFENLGAEVGLAERRVFSVVEDHTGALWFGSITGGVSRWDGKSVLKLTKNAPAEPDLGPALEHRGGLPDDNALWIFEDREHQVWIATGEGLTRFDGETLRTYTTKDGLLHDSVYAITQDASGTMWFGTQGGVCSFDGSFFRDLAEEVGKSFTNVRAVAVDRDDALWFGGQDGAFRFDGKTLKTFTRENGLLADFVGSLLVDRSGHVWFGHPGGFPDFTGGGATRWDGKSFTHFTKDNGLSVETVYCLAQDGAGNIWFGSAGDGACRWDGKTFEDMSAAAPRRR